MARSVGVWNWGHEPRQIGRVRLQKQQCAILRSLAFIMKAKGIIESAQGKSDRIGFCFTSVTTLMQK